MTKKRIISAAVGITLIGGTLVSIDGFARGAPRSGPGGGLDGPQDYPQVEHKSLLERLDSNEDGVLTLEEFTSSSSDRAVRQFDHKDEDGDGVLSLEEFSVVGGGRHPEPDGLDTDALKLCMEEILDYELPERPDPGTDFDMADSNADGSVDVDEFIAAGELRAEQRFAEIDSDGSGDITNTEIETYQTLRQERRDALHTCVDEQLSMDALLN